MPDDQAGPALNSAQYGAFLEEISHSGDGGVYGELVRNRDLKESSTSPVFWSAVAAAVTSTKSGGVTYLTVVNRGASATPVGVDLSGVSGVSGGTSTVLTGDPTAGNSIAHPTAISPVTGRLGSSGASFRHTFPADSLTVLALTTR